MSKRYVVQCPECGHWRGFIPIKPLSYSTLVECFYCGDLFHLKTKENVQVANYKTVDDSVCFPLAVQMLNKECFDGGMFF